MVQLLFDACSIYKNDYPVAVLSLTCSVIEVCLHPWVKMDKAVRPLPPRSLNNLVGLTLKLDSLSITVSVVENIQTLWFVLQYFVLLAWKDLFW